ncbi:MAG: hypothetical protein GY758_30745, partial [Fuerstiella sp.]|nr:hypothetical protein [Fuerstiella sp.]
MAIRLTPAPSVAWTVGSGSPFSYEIQAAKKSGSAAVTTNTSKTDVRFEGHTFLGVPLSHQGMLFVLSADAEMYWLNCLSDVTGRIIWQRPLLYQGHGEAGPRGQLPVLNTPEPGASLCGVDGDVILSAIRSGVVIGTRVVDGQLLWATNVQDSQTENRQKITQGVP